VEYDGPPEKLAAHIRSRNEHRRHLPEEFRKEQRRERATLAHEMREQGMSLRTIADKLGISRSQVQRDLQVAPPRAT
jgi:DNA invertase Pin-like site-specific DNA recombinase